MAGKTCPRPVKCRR